MKKLLFIHNRLVCGGAESALFDLLCLLDKTKYDITVFVLHDGGEWDQKFLDAGIRIIHSYSCLVPGQRVRNFIRRMRIKKARKKHGKNLISIATGNEKFDLVIAYHVPAVFKHVDLELVAGKIRYVHGNAKKDAVLQSALLASKESLAMCNKIICVSEDAADAMKDLIGTKEKFCVCYNPINSEKIRAKAEERPDEILPETYICAVGRLSAEKGFTRLINIHKKLRDDGIEHGLVIVGDGPEREALEKQIQMLHVEDSVYLTGYKENPYGHMKDSKFTVCSSFTEGLPVIAVESLCLGVPIVSAYPSVGELFGEECCGIITENDDASLEAGIRKMLTDPVFYNNAVQGAKRRSAAFTAEAMVAEAEKIFDAVMEEKG